MKKYLIFITMMAVVASVFAQTSPHWLQIQGTPVVDVRQFGAVGDGSTDDREAIQDAIDYALTSGKELYFSPPEIGGYYKISSLHPDTVGTASPTGLIIDDPGGSQRTTLTIRGPGQDRGYAAQLQIKGIFESGDGAWSLIRNEQDSIKIFNIGISAVNVETIIQESTGPFKVYDSVTLWGRGGTVNHCLIIPSTWVSSIRNCFFTGAEVSQVYIGEPTTSLTIMSSYANTDSSNGAEIGWHWYQPGVYSSMINCAADKVHTGYYIDGGSSGGNGFSMINCGAEETYRPITINKTSMKIDGFWTANTRGQNIITQTGTVNSFPPVIIDGANRFDWSAEAIASFTSLYKLGGAANWDVRDRTIKRSDINFNSVTRTDLRTKIISEKFTEYISNTATGTAITIPFAGNGSDLFATSLYLSGVGTTDLGALDAPKSFKADVTINEYNGTIYDTTLNNDYGISSVATGTEELIINLSDTYSDGILFNLQVVSATNRFYIDYDNITLE